MATISTGLHVVRKRLKGGERYYVYAWRGGPCIHTQDRYRPAITAELIDKAYSERNKGRGAPDAFDRVIDLYRQSPEFTVLAGSTQREYRHRLDQISARVGKAPVRLFNGRDARGEIIMWRDELAETPRAADRVVGMLSTVLNWAKERGLVDHNPAEGIKHLHKTNRADMIWEDRHWKAVKDIPPHIHRVLTLGALTGLRIGDLLGLTWESVTPAYIALKTQKTGGEAVIPLHKELKAFLKPKGRGVILRNLKGDPWTADGFQSSWRKVRPEGFDRHPHDLRGTFATRLAIAGFSDGEIADALGWTAERVATIRARYVDRTRVAKARARRLGK